MNDFAIRVDKLSKLYRIGSARERNKTFREALTNAITAPWRFVKDTLHRPPVADGEKADCLWALKDVSFEVERGEVMGIIGRNGAGKSTLLKILSRITEPTEGRITLRGRVGSLLEVGTGFHSELTGEENVYLSGTILGMSSNEISRKFDEIVAFAEMEKFIHTPVKHYSSGMYMRLAFAVAAHLEPEILLVDEVLAVGDAAFQKKCLGKMGDVAQEGRTVLFVSHNMAAVQVLCGRSILFDHGKVAEDGLTASVIDTYFQTEARGAECVFGQTTRRRGTGDSLFTKARTRDEIGRITDSIPMGQGMTIDLDFAVFGEALRSPVFGVVLRTGIGQPVLRLITHETHGEMPPARKGGTVRLKIDRLDLLPGTYYMAIGINDTMQEIDIIEDALRIEILPFSVYPTGKFPGKEKGVFMFAPCSWKHEYS